MAYGTLSLHDTLAVANNATVAAFGEDKAFQAISDYLAAHNEIMREQMSTLVEITTDRQRKAGGNSTMQMEDVDEFGRVDAQKVGAGENLGFPLRMYAIALQWTRKYFLTATTAELAAQVEAARTADVLNVQKRIKQALFLSTNYTFTDRLTDEIDLAVKRLANADSFSIPIGPNGESFTASSHTHYLARVGTLAASDITAVITTVAEHYNSGQVMLYINQAQEAAVRGFTSNFTPYIDARIVVGSGSTVAAGNLDQTNVYNRAIGIFDQAEVQVKPWVPANYMLAWHTGSRKPLAWRERSPGSSGFGLDYDNEQYPLRAQQMGREFGVGVQNRVGAAVLYTGGTSYVDPTF